jgi:uronate dehydrogenase
MLTTWLSYDDLAELMRCALFRPAVGHIVIYGVSANRDHWWDNTKAAHLGFVPRDSAERFRAKIEAAVPPPDAKDPVNKFQGGAFVRAGPFES